MTKLPPESRDCALIFTKNTELGHTLHDLLSMAYVNPILSETVHQVVNHLKMPHPPQILILDWMLPGELTTRFLQELRGSKRFAELPVLVIVDEPDPQAIKQALQAGANRYLTQSFIQANLIRTLREMQVKTF